MGKLLEIIYYPRLRKRESFKTESRKNGNINLLMLKDQKQHYKELGEELLSKNSKVLKEMRAEKAKREVPK